MQVWARLICLQPVLRAIEQHVPHSAERLIDLGSGYGLVSVLTAIRRERAVLGIEASPSRLAIARQAATGHIANVSFQQGDIAQISLSPSDTILLIDVLCLFTDGVQGHVLENCANALCPEGVLIIKDNTTTPRWKYRYTHLEERVKLWLGTYGVRAQMQPNYRAPEAWRRLITNANLRIEEECFVKSIAPYPGVIYLCRK
jgi:SAM-dependent methyltransferase